MSPQPIRFLWSARAWHFMGAALLLCASLGDPSAAFAADKKPAKDSGKKLPAKVTFFDSSSSETPAARTKRLKVECKGRPNAGMCLGHTR